MNTESNLSNPKTKTWKVGVVANVLFLVFLLFPIVTVNGGTVHSTRRFLIWIAAIAALCLRIMGKEKAAVIASFLSLIICAIVYTMLVVGTYMGADMYGAEAKPHIVTALLLLVSALIMIKPSLLGDKLQEE